MEVVVVVLGAVVVVVVLGLLVVLVFVIVKSGNVGVGVMDVVVENGVELKSSRVVSLV